MGPLVRRSVFYVISGCDDQTIGVSMPGGLVSEIWDSLVPFICYGVESDYYQLGIRTLTTIPFRSFLRSISSDHSVSPRRAFAS